MNFLSHYYFERTGQDPYLVMGTVLPDLIKNSAKGANLYPQKTPLLFSGKTTQENLLAGWTRHLAVDLFFHSSSFFIEKTAALKLLIQPLLENTSVRPSFLAHIGLELLLDHLLIEHNLVQVNHFYAHLAGVQKAELGLFLAHCGLTDPAVFYRFLDGFMSSKYLLSYQKLENISYALNRICMRLWPESLNQHQLDALTILLEGYKNLLEKDFMNIFEEITSKLETASA